MKVFILNGLQISTNCSYVRFVVGLVTRRSVALDGLTLTISFISGATSQDISRLYSDISLIELKALDELPVRKINTPLLRLGSASLRKLEQDNHIFRQFIVRDLSENVKLESSGSTTLLIKPATTLSSYKSLLGSLNYFDVEVQPISIPLENFMVNIPDRDIVAKSVNNFQYSSKDVYAKYILSTVDVIAEWKRLVGNILKEKSIDFLSITANKMPATESYITYKINSHPVPLKKKVTDDRFTDYFEVKSVLELEINTMNLVVLDWFRQNFNDIRLLSNLTSFPVKDALGKEWKVAAMWPDKLPEDFEHVVAPQNSQDKHSFSATFNCELYYFMVSNPAPQTLGVINSVLLDVMDEFRTENRRIIYDMVLDKYEIGDIFTRKFLVLNNIEVVNSQLVLHTSQGDRYLTLSGITAAPNQTADTFNGTFGSNFSFQLPLNTIKVLTLGVENDAYVDPDYYTINYTVNPPILRLSGDYLQMIRGDRYWGAVMTNTAGSNTSAPSSGLPGGSTVITDPYQFVTRYFSGEDIPSGRAIVNVDKVIYLYNPMNITHVNKFIGISTQTVLSGSTVPLIRTGFITNSLFVFSEDLPIFIHPGGTLSTVPSMQYLIVQQVGRATNENSFVIDLNTPTIRQL